MGVTELWDHEDVRDFAGIAAYMQGESLVRRNAVVSVELSLEESSLAGVVADSDAVHSQYIEFGNAGGYLLPVLSMCTCGSSGHCAHVAAVLLQLQETVAQGEQGRYDDAGNAAARDVSEWADLLGSGLLAPELGGTSGLGGRGRRKKDGPGWRALLEPLATAAATPSGGRPLALQFALQKKPYAQRGERTHALAMRLVAMGDRGKWVRGQISWDKLDYPGREYDFDPGQIALAKAINALSGRSWYYYSSSAQTIALDDIANPMLWEFLRQAAASGFELIHEGRSFEPVTIGEPVDAVLDVSDDGAGLTVSGRWEGAGELPRGEIAWIGREAHGAYWHEPITPDTRLPDVRVNLAPLARPLPPAVVRWFTQSRPVRVPAEDREEFGNRILLPLQSAVGISSADGSYTPPDPPRPHLHLRVRPVSIAAWQLSWDWRYGSGEYAAAYPLGTSSGPMRDTGAEGQILKAVKAASGEFSPLWVPEKGKGRPAAKRHGAGSMAAIAGWGEPKMHSGLLSGMGAGPQAGRRAGHAGKEPAVPAPPQRPGDLARETTLLGEECVRFQEHVLPRLRLIDGVEADMGAQLLTPASEQAVISVGTEEQPGSTDWFDLTVSVTVDGQDVPFEALFAGLAMEDEYLILPSGTFFPLDRPEFETLRQLIEEARALSDKPGGMSISSYQFPLWEELEELGIVGEQAKAWRKSVERLRGALAPHRNEVPPGFHGELRNYQHDGYDWLCYLQDAGIGGILADDMGLGKTVQCLAFIERTLAGGEPPVPPFLVVAPTSVVANWASEAQKFVPGRKVAVIEKTDAKAPVPLATAAAGAGIVVTSYALFRIDFERYSALEWSGLILDEAQMVKNRQGQGHQCARKLRTPLKLAVTGTPMENNVMELWSLLSITNPGLFPKPERFRQFFAKPIESGNHPELLDTLRRRIRPFMLRRTKEQVAIDLPPKQEQVLELQLPAAQQRVYSRHLQRERQKVLGLLGDMDANRFQIFRSLTILRQLALDCSLVQADYASVPSAKLDRAVDLLRDMAAEGHRALVFSQFTSFLGKLRDRLEHEGIAHVYLDGKTKDRGAVIGKFKQGDVPVFLISLKAGGFGLNLTEADYCLMLDPWWNPATEAQAIDRTHRIGQDKQVMVYRLVSKGTIEEKVMAMKARKAALFDAVVTADATGPVGLTEQDIRELLA